MIYDLLLASILGICGSDASVAYPFPCICDVQGMAAAAAGKKSSSSGMPALGWWLMAVGALRVGLTCSGFFGAHPILGA
jgi:hypothetical protein